MATTLVATGPIDAVGAQDVVWLTQDDFTYGTYIIDQPGTYRLAEDIRFNPNSPATLTRAIENGTIPAEVAAQLGLTAPVDAYRAGMPLPTQFLHGTGDPFTPGGPLDPRYDPAAYGIGFFAAIAIEADGVLLDLNGKTLEQSPEHALLQRFFAVVELADQPFVPGQGPAGFGDEIEAAERVVIRNGRLGRSSHHGIHGNANADVVVDNVRFEGYEVGAIALNGVDGLRVGRVTARNRTDVPVLGTFSSGMFIKAYVDDLVRSGSTTTLTVGGSELTAVDIQQDLRQAINNVHHDIIVDPNVVGGRPVIDAAAHPVEYALFHNEHGVIDGNSYSFLVNHLGVAVGGFPTQPDGEDRIPSRKVWFNNVHVVDQQSFINEIPALDAGIDPAGANGKATIDPVGAVFQVKNLHPDTGAPVTVSSLDDSAATYVGNPVANAQALVAKAALAGDTGSGRLDISRMNISATVLDWVEGEAGAETLADIGARYLCNGDSMFHVNKGAIGFKIDSVNDARLINTSVLRLDNKGAPGTTLCGDYSDGKSHPDAALLGYGGAAVRAYTFAGSKNVVVFRSTATNLRAASGLSVGYAVLTDSTNVRLVETNVHGVTAGYGQLPAPDGPDGPVFGAAVYVGPGGSGVQVSHSCGTSIHGHDATYGVHDLAGDTTVSAWCED